MSLALEKLLGGPVCHGGTQILVRDDGKLNPNTNHYCETWIKAYEARESGNKEETLKLVRKATADLPPADFMAEMMELYPDAKVVHVRRDPPQRWWDSIQAVTARTAPWWFGVVLAPIPGWRHLATFASVQSRSTLRLAGLDPATATPSDLIRHGGPRESGISRRQTYILEAYHKKVASLVPERQLLEMELDDGWGPLCRFLDATVPNTPFPRVNDAKAADKYATGVLPKALGV
ncbi:hypothetical protein PG996_002679 [Apiospora saccharicola]|uniref:Uncharacterized protein n=1 Tax=Apiospora saccharicola TaxID=335842 RepID=A0ABR1WPH3_9PEZI